MAAAFGWLTQAPAAPPPEAPLVQLVSAAIAHQPWLQLAGGLWLLLHAKHCKHVVLFAQAVQLLAWPALVNSGVGLREAWSNLTEAAATVPPDQLASAALLYANTRSQYEETRRAMAAATAAWRNGTLDYSTFSQEMRAARATAAELARKAATADAALSFASAAAARIDPSALYSSLSVSASALASALAISTSRPAAALLNGASLGADASNVIVTQLGEWQPFVLLEETFAPLSSEKRRWARSLVDCMAAALCAVLARRARGAAATLSASALGASAVVDAARHLGWDRHLKELVGALCTLGIMPMGVAEEIGGADGADAAEDEFRLAFFWQQVRLVLLAFGAIYQLFSEHRLPLIVRTAAHTLACP
jgi:hypothetical protein